MELESNSRKTKPWVIDIKSFFIGILGSALLLLAIIGIYQIINGTDQTGRYQITGDNPTILLDTITGETKILAGCPVEIAWYDLEKNETTLNPESNVSEASDKAPDEREKHYLKLMDEEPSVEDDTAQKKSSRGVLHMELKNSSVKEDQPAKK